MENEKTGCTSPLEIEGPILCVNSCGFFGNPTNMNMCSQCYKDAVFKLEQIKPSASSIEQQVVSSRERAINVSQPSKSVDEIFMKNRCTACKKRVGLTATFKCRCGDLFCGSHRYSDKHECPFDYRTAGRDAIAKANPVVKAEKLDKI